MPSTTQLGDTVSSFFLNASQGDCANSTFTSSMLGTGSSGSRQNESRRSGGGPRPAGSGRPSLRGRVDGRFGDAGKDTERMVAVTRHATVLAHEKGLDVT